MKKKFALLLAGVILLTSCTLFEAPDDVPVNLEHQEAQITPLPDDSAHSAEEDTPVFTPVLVPEPADVPPPEYSAINSGGVYMYNLETGTAVYKRNEHERFPPASIAKIMTMLVVLENVPDLNQLVEVTDEAFADFDSGDPNFDGAAIAWIEPGQANLTYLDVLYALMLPSGCEAANILAYNAGGRNIAAFIDMMNEKAAELGCLNTNFTNASGLYEEDFYSSAYDMFLITKHTYEKHPLLMQISEKPSYSMPPNAERPDGYNVRNANAGLWLIHELDFATGIKIGSIYEYFHGGVRLDGFTTFVSKADRDGMSFLTVSLGADYYDEDGNWAGYHYEDHAVLYEWAYETFGVEFEIS
ncbi:MAG: serine hydrolase [Oscillospiraceae bacterium]|jgi:D-alanyl-D-alanine carboxypeptidase (penicillin-binding protein 5/6)|nr:serine hydrolase [Oscillospiraceae bacterium]